MTCLPEPDHIVVFVFDGHKTCVIYGGEVLDFEILVLDAQKAFWDVQTYF